MYDVATKRTFAGMSVDEVRQEVHGFIDNVVLPIEEELEDVFSDARKYWREDGRLSDEVVEARKQVRMKSAEAGFYTMFCPVEVGGQGLSASMFIDVWQSIGERFGSPQTQLAYFVLSHPSMGPSALWNHASDDLRAEMFDSLLSGELQGSFVMSEPQAGSDAWAMKADAVRDGDDWVLNGVKMWASHGPTADFIITFQVSDWDLFKARKGGVTGFYVPTNTPGLTIEEIIKTYDHVGGEECRVRFDSVRVPDSYRIGPAHQGFAVGMEGSGLLKLTKLGRAIGLGSWALQKATEYARERETFGQKLIDHQTIMNILAEGAVDVFSSKLIARELASLIDEGKPSRFEEAMANYHVWERMFTVYDNAIQVLGGAGVLNSTGMINGWTQLRTVRLSEGPSEVQLRAVGKLLKSGARS